jgi:hypothetical protein
MRLLPFLLVAALAPGLALANDGVSSVSAGGVVFRKTDAIAMKKEVLNVSQDLISVDYEFVNESSSDVEETMAFPLPVYAAAENPTKTYYGQPDGFTIEVDGKPVGFTTVLVALYAGQAITGELKDLGLTDAQIAFNPAFGPAAKVTPLSPRQRRQLTELRYFGDGKNDDAGPLWDVQVNYVWKQKFAVNKVVRVHHAYRPFVAYGPSEWGMERAFCADAAFKKAWARLAAKTDGRTVLANNLGYILKTGNTWKNGIEDFTLNLIKKEPEELISLCFPGTFKKIDARTLQVRLKNFHPTQDLEVYFGNIADGGYGREGVMPVLKR